ncbi:FAD/NAD(P)-binding protein [Xenorhabdus japonica]|uniref:Uncharacterized NAD(P)/FAD-binding protein YdhS n=1 Tax=Xenorhabdus japonica TaxID=53341 RepID=A0A1I4YD38_9GAMM|nr:FAD/NAD(P)-binding protein [Xenorhabdus japonica]SFN35957.1 Uncharacterized NAD(P)/FAD-binding protein YdhS [Xenorhabdus japonica]
MKFDIAFIGAGATTVTYLDSLVKSLTNKNKKASIVIFDEKMNFGCGNVYNNDYPWLLMNTPVEDLSAVYGINDDYISWHKSVNHGNIERYVSRNNFGNYLKSKIKEIIYDNNSLYHIKPIFSKANRLEEIENGYIIHAVNGVQIETRKVILASGRSPDNYEDHYHIGHSKKFILNPLPLITSMEKIEPEKNILILGAGLTSIDCAITINKIKNAKKLTISSRTAALPEVKGNKLKSNKPIFFTHEKLMNEKSKIGLRDILRLLRKELKIYDIKWRDYYFSKLNINERISYFKQQIELAENSPTNFNIILGIIPELARTLPYVKKDDIELLMSEYYHYIQQKHGAIPLINARKILNMIEEEKLKLKKGIISIKSLDDKFEVNFSDGSIETFDYIINATGPNRKICNGKTGVLIDQLCESGSLQEIKTGGIKVKYPEGNVKNGDKSYKKNLIAVGHNAEGTHIFTNNYQWIVETCYLSANELTNSL